MADHLLAHGLGAAQLRALAAAAGTSDRMLLYYFRDKDELLAATLARIAERLTAILDAALPAGVRLPAPALQSAVWQAMRSPVLKAYMQLWLELAAGSARLRSPDRAIAMGIMDGFVAWTMAHLDAGADAERQAAQLLVSVEGMLFLDAVGRGDLAALAVPES